MSEKSRSFTNLTARLRPTHSGSNLVSTTLGWTLHIGFVTIHIALIALIAVWATEAEKKVTIPLGSESNRLSLAINVLSQFTIIVYTAVLVSLAQEVALRSYLSRHHTLTAVHDKIAAWSGVGLSFLSLWRQLSLPSSFFGVFAIAVYLLSISATHITTPGLFSLRSINSTIAGTIAAFNNPLAGPNLLRNAIDFDRASLALLNTDPTSDGSQNVGLYGNMIYAVVNGSHPYFVRPNNVTSYSTNIEEYKAGEATKLFWTVQTALQNFTMAQTPIPELSSKKNVISGLANITDDVLLYGKVPIKDVEGGSTTQVNLDPEVADFGAWTGAVAFEDPKVVACSMQTSQAAVTVDATTGLVKNATLPLRTNSQVFEDFLEPTDDPNEGEKNRFVPVVNTQSRSWIPAITSCDVGPYNAASLNVDAIIPDQSQDISISTSSGLDIRQIAVSLASQDDLALVDLETPMENALATVFWNGNFCANESAQQSDVGL
ncbi:hypothetical protein BT69DRAFT_1338611 [Atractiella rhizophila]|nr:hypothetical protein BT69DRAFT_1338611 [Atractiella rhizophila]